MNKRSTYDLICLPTCWHPRNQVFFMTFSTPTRWDTHIQDSWPTSTFLGFFIFSEEAAGCDQSFFSFFLPPPFANFFRAFWGKRKTYTYNEDGIQRSELRFFPSRVCFICSWLALAMFWAPKHLHYLPVQPEYLQEMASVWISDTS